ncbi:ABC transporter substrate-binding protein [Leucobacter albus]|uniref:ABC transporter substrate-binding protein n=1 Tax=Leucobacter albus TaxID=272210 RepID=A0ABW3TIW4_9MICO
MKTSRSRLLSGAAALAAATLALTGCSGGGDAATTEKLTFAEVPKEDTTLKVWTFLPDNYENGNEAYEDIIAAFNEQYPQVEVELTTMPYGTYWDQLRNSGVSRSGPDVVTMYGGAQAYSYRNSLFPLQDAIDPAIEGDLRYLEDNYSSDGNLYILPTGAYGYALLVNQDLFASAGVDPQTLATWDGMIGACQALDAKGILPFATGWQDGILMETLMYMITSQQMDADTLVKWTQGELKLDDPLFGEAVDRILEMNEAGCFGGEEGLGRAMYDDAFNQYYAGDAAMFTTGGLATAETGYSDQPSTTVMPLPQVPESKYESLIDAGAEAGWSVTKWTKSPEAANAFVNFMGGAEAQQILWDVANVVPNNNAVEATPKTPMQEVFVPLIVNDENHTGFSSYPLEVLAVIERNAGPLISGKLSRDEFLEQAIRAFDKSA